jgi:hypothetical protein
MKPQAWSFFILFFFIQGSAFADVIGENFTTSNKKDASGTTAVWNLALGIIHPNLQVSNYQVTGFPVVPITHFEVGNGSDGAFSLETYANFGSVSGSIITVNALSKPVLNVTSFQLVNGYTLTAINGPLIIYSQSTVRIDGTINCSGLNGENSAAALGGSGGNGRCDGKNGGAGGNMASSGFQGLPVSGDVTAGQGGQYSTGAGGGGGGGGGAYAGNDGSNGDSSTPPTNSGGAGGAGSAGANHQFTILNGSPGGGGGSGSNLLGAGGGGAGGGTVVIHAVGDIIISATGSILARGGNGGNAFSGGSGGGGGGGSVKIFTLGNLELDSGTSVDVTGGIAGTTQTGNAGVGGTGSFGRTWLNYSTFSGNGTESHPSLLQQLGTIEYNTTLQQVTSLSYDTLSSSVIYNSVSTDNTNADISLEVAGSIDNFATASSGWLPLSQLSNLNNNRYIKYKISLTNSNATSPTTIDSLAINYNPNLPPPPPAPPPLPSPSPAPAPNNFGVNNYQFSSGGCGMVKTAITPSVSGFSKHIDSRNFMLHVLLVCLLMIGPVFISLKLRSRNS